MHCRDSAKGYFAKISLINTIRNLFKDLFRGSTLFVFKFIIGDPMLWMLLDYYFLHFIIF